MIRFNAAEKFKIELGVVGSVDYDAAFDTISATDAVATPASGTVTAAGTADVIATGADLRQLRFFSAKNRGALNTVTLKKDIAGTERHLFTATLATGEFVQYSSNVGWQVFDAAGRVKVLSTAPTSRPPVSTVKGPLNKVSIGTQVAGSFASKWQAAGGYPAAGATPVAAAVCTNTLLGALPLANRTGTQKRLLTGVALNMATAGQTGVVEDRLLHMGGLNGTLTTAQTVNLDISVATNNLQARCGLADYSEVEWWLEWYVATGSTIATPTVQVTYTDLTTGSANIWVAGATALPASVAAGRRYKIIPAAGKIIRSIQSVTLSASTLTAGNFGVTATRTLDQVVCDVGTKTADKRIEVAGAVAIEDEACLSLSTLCITTSTGLITGYLNQTVVD
jgi:hypothetical protein